MASLHLLLTPQILTQRKYVDTDPAQAMRVTHAYGDQESTKTMMTTKAIFASFHSVLMDCCWSSVDFLTWEPSFSTSLPEMEEGERGEGECSQRNTPFRFLFIQNSLFFFSCLFVYVYVYVTHLASLGLATYIHIHINTKEEK